MARLKDLMNLGYLRVSGSVTAESLRIGGINVTINLNSDPIADATASNTPGQGLTTVAQVRKYILSLFHLPDQILYVEDDNSVWVHVFHHNNPRSKKFNSSNSFKTYVYIDEDRYFCIAEIANRITSEWEFIARQKNTADGEWSTYRWKQTVNPMTATFNNTINTNITKVTGSTSFGGSYTSLSASYGGLYYNNMSNSYLVQNNTTNGNWWGSVGCWTDYSSSIPGFNNQQCTTGCMDLYIRIDNHTNI